MEVCLEPELLKAKRLDDLRQDMAGLKMKATLESSGPFRQVWEKSRVIECDGEPKIYCASKRQARMVAHLLNIGLRAENGR